MMLSQLLGNIVYFGGDTSQHCAATVKECPNFNANEAAAALEKAMKAKGVDEPGIIRVLANCSNAQRQKIKLAYQQLTGKPLVDALKKTLSGQFEEVVLALMMTPPQYDAHSLRTAMKGLGTDEDCLIEILASRENNELKEIAKVYKEEYKKDLEKDITGDTSGDFKKALLALLKANRSECTRVDEDLADNDARAFYEAGEKRKGTHVDTYIDILTSRSYQQLKKMNECYGKYSKNDVAKAVDLELKGDIEACLMAIMKVAQNKPAFFAEEMFKAMKGSGTNHKKLIRLLVSRCECDLNNIKREFKNKYGMTLHKAIVAEKLKGDYLDILLTLCGGDD